MTGKKLLSYQLLQALHLLAYGGLGTAHRGGSGGKGAQIGNSNKGSQQIEVEIQYRTISIYHINPLTGAETDLPY